MGTAGAALATALSQVVSFVILLMMCNTKADALSIRFKNFKPSLKIYGSILYNGVPSLGRQGIASISTILLNTAAGVYGDAAIAAVGLVGQPRMLLMALFFALNIGVTALVARRKGEGRQDDANLVMRNALVIILILSVVIMLVAIQFSKDLMWLAGAKEDTIEQANIYFCILTAVLPVNAMTLCINAALRGIGNTRTTLKVNLTSNIVNIIFNYLLIGGNLGFPRLGVTGAAIATAIGIVFGFFLCIIAIIPHKGSDQFLKLSRHDNWKLDKTTVKSIFSVGGNAMIEQAALRFGFRSVCRASDSVPVPQPDVQLCRRHRRGGHVAGRAKSGQEAPRSFDAVRPRKSAHGNHRIDDAVLAADYIPLSAGGTVHADPACGRNGRDAHDYGRHIPAASDLVGGYIGLPARRGRYQVCRDGHDNVRIDHSSHTGLLQRVSA